MQDSMTKITVQELMYELPTQYRNSQFAYAYFSAFVVEYNLLYDRLVYIRDHSNLEKAEYYHLDIQATNYGLFRYKDETDANFRRRIRAHIAQFSITPTETELKSILVELFNPIATTIIDNKDATFDVYIDGIDNINSVNLVNKLTPLGVNNTVLYINSDRGIGGFMFSYENSYENSLYANPEDTYIVNDNEDELWVKFEDLELKSRFNIEADTEEQEDIIYNKFFIEY